MLLSRLKHNWDKIILALVLLIIVITNFTPNTWLIGWDNLLPELNIWVNLKRSFFAVWQEYQGLGLVGGMGHATELIRQLIILPLVLILPHNLIRYLWHFLMLILGAFSINIGLQKTFKFSKTISLLSSFFYLLNFGTIQYFWVPFEPFSTFWGFFPLLFFTLWDFLKQPNKRNLINFTVFNLLAIPSFYVQTIFFVYLICVSIILFSFLILNFNKEAIKSSLSILIIIIFLNLFWLLPFSYYFKNDINNTTTSFGNLMSTQETFDRNQYRGTIGDFLLLRGYYFDFPANNGTIMNPWSLHLSNQYYLICGYFLSLFIIIGLISISLKTKQKSSINLSLILLFLISSIALLSSTPIFSQINYLIRQVPLINQVFRSPWTKFLVPSAFVFSILLAFGLNSILNFLKKIKYSYKISNTLISFLFVTSLLIFSFPVFQGNFFYPQIRQKIPQEYFDLFNFFDQVPSTARIINLPQGSFWGWTTYRWGSDGSGFLWYGLNQPIMDRAFDVWNLKNEKYYWELTTALQQKNSLALNDLINKYSVQYIIFDKSIYFPDEKIYSKSAVSQIDLLSKIPNLKLVKNFGSIYIFENQNPTQIYTTNQINNNYQIASFNPNFSPTYIPASNLNTFPFEHSQMNSQTVHVDNDNDSYFQFKNQLSHKQLGFSFPKVAFNQDYLLKIESKNIQGQTPIISVFDNNSHYYFFKDQLKKSNDWQTTWFLIPKMENFSFDTGLIVLFDNPSFNKIDSINEIKDPQIFPYQNNIPLIDNYQPPLNNYLESKSNIFLYKSKINQNNNPYLVLPQSFHKGWSAFYLKNFKIIPLKDHSIANDWANSWNISNINSNTTIYIIFWPQILEFLGLALLIPTFIWVCKKRK